MQATIKSGLLYRWTDDAINCYYRGCVCSDCPMYEMIGSQCQMKRSVLGLVRKFGKPEKRN